jgi:hypothetical protein
LPRLLTLGIALACAASSFTVATTSAVAETAAVAADTFARTTTGGWGSAERGGSWTSTGASSRWSVAGGKGAYVMEAPGVGGWNHLAVSTAEVDGRVDLSVDKTPTGGGVHLATAVRRTGSSEYRFDVRLTSTGAVVLGLTRVVDGAETTLGGTVTVPGLSYVRGDVLRLRFQAAGTGPTTLKARVWKVGAAEPSTPQITRTDSATALQRAGGVGVFSYLSSSASNAPVRLSVDNLDVAESSSTSTTTTPTAPSSPAPSPSTTTLVNATFDSLPTGRVTAEGFVSALGGGNTNEYPYDDSSIVADSRGSGKVYRLKLDAGSYRDYPAGNNGIVSFIALKREVDNACVSYDIKFDGTFDWSLGGKLPGLQGTAPGVSVGTPTGGGYPGDKGWSSRGMWLGPRAYSWAGPTNMAVSYVYGPRQESYYGDNEQWKKAFVAGRWHTVKQCHTMNTVGSANGRLQAWMDGVQVLDIDDHVYRTRNDVHIKHLNWSIFRGGGSREWSGSRTGYVDIDNVRVTTS